MPLPAPVTIAAFTGPILSPSGTASEILAAVVAAGFGSKSEPWDAFWGRRYAQVVDPDGNAVDLFAPLDG